MGKRMIKVLQKRFDELHSQVLQVEATRQSSRNAHSELVDKVDTDLLLNWCVKTRSLIANACGKESEHFLSFVEAEKPRPYEGSFRRLKKMEAVFLAAKEDFEGGYLSSIRNLVQAEVFDNELDQARELLAAGYKIPAAVIAGVVLETGLRTLCGQQAIPVGKLDKMNADLAKAGRYNSLVQKRITALAGVRNSAAHGNAADFAKEDVVSMLDEVERFVADFLS
jgi:hypothetical protein